MSTIGIKISNLVQYVFGGKYHWPIIARNKSELLSENVCGGKSVQLRTTF